MFDRVRAIAADRFVPLEETTRQLTDGGPAWLLQLRAEVVADAVARGLVRARRFGGWMVLVSILAGMAIAGLALVPVQRDPLSRAENAIAAASVPGWFCGTIFVAFILILIASSLTRTPGQTRLGAAVGSRWLGVGHFLSAHKSLADLPPAAVAVWDRYLAYGVALGVNPVASRAIDLTVARRVQLRSSFVPAASEDRRAARPKDRSKRAAEPGSQFLGTPHLIEVRYPRGALHYTQAGVRLLWSLVLLAIWSGVGFAVRATGRSWPAPVRDVVVVVGLLAVLRALYTLVRAVHAKLVPVTVVGQVLARHPFRVTAPGTFGWVQIVIDDSRHRRTRPWLVRADRLGTAQVGDVVTIRAQRWTNFVLSLAVEGSISSTVDSH